MPRVIAFSASSTPRLDGSGTPQSRHPPWPASIATTIALGFGSYTALPDPGAGSTAPASCVAVAAGVVEGWTVGIGDAVCVALPASQAAVTKTARVTTA